MKIGFMFAGQGSQFVGMGKDFYENSDKVKAIYDQFPNIRDLCFQDQENVLNQTAYCQKAMLLTGYAIAEQIREQGIEPEYCCGLSLGEYTALAFSKVWELQDAVEIVSKRGEIMQNALPLGTTKMAAIIGLSREVIESTIQEVDGVCEIANYNCPGQIVITGKKESVEKAMVLLQERGARRALPLNVSGAFHSSLLKNASVSLYEELQRHTHCEPIYKIVYNVSAKEEKTDLNEILKNQICHSVYFEDSIRYMIQQGVDTFIEIGPGKTLSGFVRKINSDVTVYSITTVEDLNKCLKEIK